MSSKENCLIIAGEKSGEEHCLSFFHQLKEYLPQCDFWGVGGEPLAEAGVDLVYHLNDFSSWGVSEVIEKIPFYFKALDKIEKMVVDKQCKVAILIDFQTFNMKLAQRLKKRGVHILYYVAPQAWAWKKWRTKTLAKTVDTLFTILPFEKKWFNQRGVKQVISVDHPLWRHYRKYFPAERKIKDLKEGFNLLLLPGSRNAEVRYLLPDFADTAKEMKSEYNAKISVVCSSSVNPKIFEPYKNIFDTIYNDEQLVPAMQNADLALAASGTVTLATALFQLPTVVAYRSSLFNEWIYRTFVNYNWYFCLANIIHNKMVFPELLQDEVSEYNLSSQLKKWITNKDYYLETISKLGKTETLVQAENRNIPQFMAEIVKKSYE